jgi:hypothetical protein
MMGLPDADSMTLKAIMIMSENGQYLLRGFLRIELWRLIPRPAIAQ